MAEDAGRSQLVVIGSSAGGIEALSILVGTLPADFPAPIILAQHLDPRRPSHLGEILAARSALPVVTVGDHADLQRGTIHVVPANRHVTVTDHAVSLAEPPIDGRPVPSVDHVFKTAASVFGEGLIAVILTGTGSDGSDGARAVKASGGTVIIQDPETARFPSMPGSLAPTTVDIVASIEAIGPLIHDLVTNAEGPSEPEDERLLTRFLDDLRARTGIDFSSYKRPTIQRRLQRRMAATGVGSLRDYVRFVARNPDEYQRLTSSFLIKVTEFFRDPDLFDHLRSTVLPDVIAEARKDDRTLRLWSAGCATGEEPFSLAILVAEALGDELPDWTVRIFATDLDGDAVNFARRGIYPASTLEHLPPELVERYFVHLDGEYEVRRELRAMTVFGQHDLALRAPFPRIDVALCRNVLIYFTAELQRRALQLFAFSLRDGGWLVLGKAETTSPLPDFFVLDEPRLKLFRRRGERPLIPPMRTQEGASLPSLALPRGGRATGRVLGPGLPQPVRQRPSGDKAEGMLAVLPIGVALVDQEYDVLALNPAARRLLGIHGGAIGEDFIHLVAGLPTTDLRRVIDEALRGGSDSFVARLDVQGGAADGGHAWLEIGARAVLGDGPEGRPTGAVVTVRDVTAERLDIDARDASIARAAGESEQINAQLESLRQINRKLLLDNEELVSANADLRGANEELLVANEEVQAATEEVETLNEELQATNEELETLNEELQATVEELNTTNDDMQARTAELQDTTLNLEEQRRTAETERSRLATLIATMRDGVLVVDRNGRPAIRNPAFEQMFGPGMVIEAEHGEPLDLAQLRDRVARGEEFTIALSAQGPKDRRRWYEASARPVPVEMGIGDGGILVVHDTTDVSLRRWQEEFVGIVAHELRTPLTALRGYLQMLQRSTSESGGRVLPLAIQQADRLQRLVAELFDVTRVERGGLTMHPEPVSIVRLVDETIEIARGLSDRHTFTVEHPDGDVTAEVDPARIQQILLNLLMNAIVHGEDATDIEVRVRKLRRRIELEVEDHGPGIAAEAQATLFSRFVQGSTTSRGVGASGLGLGLYIAREIALAHGGTIDVDSAAGEGTTFTVRLPLRIASTRAGEDTANGSGNGRSAPSGGGKGMAARRKPAEDGAKR
jgi:two-component system CheB/CheR fusion protein